MTQKELSYVEDAIGHESNIIKIINDSINNLGNDELLSFMQNEVEKHEKLKEKLLSLLEAHINDW